MITDEEFKKLKERLDKLETVYYTDNFIGEQIFNKKITFREEIDMRSIRIMNDDKMGFFGTTPVVQQDTISSPSGGDTTDTQARSAIGSILTVLINLGLIKSA